MEERMTTAAQTGAAQTAIHTIHNNNMHAHDWQQALLSWWHEWHLRMVTKAETYLDRAAKVDFSGSSSTSTQEQLSWNEELVQLNEFASWPGWNYYQECMKKAYLGLQDIGYWIWLTVRPWIYSALYLFARVAQYTFGRLFPKIQYTVIEVCRFQLHLTWRQALGELSILVLAISVWKLVRYLQKKKYLQRTKHYVRQKKKQVTKVRRYIYIYIL
jgi:hypothetical protein